MQNIIFIDITIALSNWLRLYVPLSITQTNLYPPAAGYKNAYTSADSSA